MRTRIGRVVGHCSTPSAHWTTSAALTASRAWRNTAKTLSPSPLLLTTVPFCRRTQVATIPSCRASARRIALGWLSHSLVLPSMSVSRKVTTPVGWVGGDESTLLSSTGECVR
jgi:hypothetical protein